MPRIEMQMPRKEQFRLAWHIFVGALRGANWVRIQSDCEINFRRECDLEPELEPQEDDDTCTTCKGSGWDSGLEKPCDCADGDKHRPAHETGDVRE